MRPIFRFVALTRSMRPRNFRVAGADACDGRTMVGPGNLAIPGSARSRSSLRQGAVVAFVR